MYGLNRSVRLNPAPRVSLPVFETYASHGTEAKVKALDRGIYDALLDLKVPAEDVVFNRVETKAYHEDRWTYSELAICLQEAVPEGHVKAAFYQHLAGIIPQESMAFRSAPHHKIILELSVNGHRTHHLAFLPFTHKKVPSPPAASLPQIAIIIDDLGYDDNMATRFLELDGVLSFSILPYSPFQQEIAYAVHRSGRDVLLHLPMEPLEYPSVNPGEGALMSAMGPDELLDQLRKDLDAVPFVVGVNNHMGSKLTQDSAKMRQVFTILKGRNLFFVDSLTNPKSRCARAAHLLNLKFARRHVFLDHDQTAHAIRFQIKRLVTIAESRGSAIGIGHPYPVTWEILKEEIPKLRGKVRLVPISKLVG
jgi:polysaccharide deacetylase 2 family uncharacterized protein YibQ